MNKSIEMIYNLGKNAHDGNDISLIKLIELKRQFILQVSYDDEDCYQFIIEKLIKGIKNYNF